VLKAWRGDVVWGGVILMVIVLAVLSRNALVSRTAQVGPSLGSVLTRQAALERLEPALRSDAARLPRLVAVGDESGTFLRALDGLAGRTGVTVRNVSLGTPTPSGSYTAYPYSLQLTGPVPNLLAFLYSLPRLPGGPTGVPLTGVSLAENNAGNRGTTTGTLGLTVVRYAAGEAAIGPAAPAGSVAGG
jgi:hypothetical protein